MKIKTFEMAGVIFNANQIVTIQKVTLTNDEDKEKPEVKKPAISITTVLGGINFSFETEKERDEKFTQLFNFMRN